MSLKIATLFALILIGNQSCTNVEEAPSTVVATTKYFEFNNNFWLNMHHFLYNVAYTMNRDTTKFPVDLDVWNNISAEEQSVMNQTLAFYVDNIVDKDLRTDDDLYAFKRWIINLNINDKLISQKFDQDYITSLNQVKSVYEKYFWDQHAQHNLKVLNENIGLIRKLENAAVQRLTEITQAPWDQTRIRVDLSFRSKLNRPYTTVRPTHIVMETDRNSVGAGNWFELVFHESSHNLISPRSGAVALAIKNASSEFEIEAPRQFWHAVLFYFSGVVSRDVLESDIPGYELYMVRRNVFGSYYPYLQASFDPYLAGEISLEGAIGNFLKSYSQKSLD